MTSASRPFGRERHPPPQPDRFGRHTGRGRECRAPHAARMVMTSAIGPSLLPKPRLWHAWPAGGAAWHGYRRVKPTKMLHTPHDGQDEMG